jgi:hypothetical protein
MTCPGCGDANGRHLPHPSQGAFVDYYRCDACECVWNVRKGDRRDALNAVNVEPIKAPLKTRQPEKRRA